MSLYRKYRPQIFADVVGQDSVVTTLENAVHQDKLSHAYLFSGSRGTGKTSVARILAKHLLTQGITDETLKRHIEQSVTDGTIVDLIEIDGASNRRIEDSRDLIEKIQFSPVVTNAKVYIIDEVHMLTTPAFNALLKTLEEPPSYAYFILATTELQKIPATIQSRCLRFAFRQIREEDMVRRLQYIADQEHIIVDRLALRAIAHHAQGGLRDAIALLDQLRSLEKISLEDVQQRIGETGRECLELLLTALEKKDRKDLLKVVQMLEETGIPLDTFVRQVLAEMRMNLHTALEEGKPIEPYTHLLDVFLLAIRDMRIAPVPGLVLEAALLSLLDEPETPTKKTELRFLKKKDEAPAEAEKKPEAATAKEDRAKSVEEVKEKVIAETAIVEAPELTLATVSALWPAIVAEATPAALKQSLKSGRIVAVTEKALTLSFSAKFHRERVLQSESAFVVEQLLTKHLKRRLKLECVLDEERAAQPIANEGMVNLAEAVNEIFLGIASGD